jgi:hypothetical protein
MDQITTYATLQSAVAGMLHRSADTNITANVPLFIQLLEAELNDRLLLKNQETEGTLTLAQGQNYVALPSGYVSPIALWLIVDSERVLLKPALPQELPYNTDSTQPEFLGHRRGKHPFRLPCGRGVFGQVPLLRNLESLQLQHDQLPAIEEAGRVPLRSNGASRNIRSKRRVDFQVRGSEREGDQVAQGRREPLSLNRATSH